jgi:hypothetical protein
MDPNMQLSQVIRLNGPLREFFPGKYDNIHMSLAEMIVCAHADVFIGNLFSSFSTMVNHYRHVLSHHDHDSSFFY